MNQYEGMNGLEVLYTILFVEWDKGLWGIIALGVIFALVSIITDDEFQKYIKHFNQDVWLTLLKKLSIIKQITEIN